MPPPLPPERQGTSGHDLRTAGIVHDVNQLLTVIVGRARLLAGRLADEGAAAELEGLAQAAQDAAGVLGRLTGAGVGAGGDLAEAVARALAVIAPPDGSTWDGGPWRAEVRVPPGLATGVPGLEVREVLHNLLLNSLAAMPGGGTVSLAAETRGDRVLLRVADTGPGLPPGEAERIFELGHTTSGAAGRGVGLAACRALLAERGADLALAEPAAGRGAAFVLDLPAGAAPVPASTSASKDLAGRRVLVVDDEPGVAGMLGDVLRSWGCVPALAGGAEAVRDRFVPGGFDAALVDWTLPAVSGLDLAAWLRRRDPALGVVLTTGLDREGELAGTVGRDVDYTLVKPLDLDDLRRVLDDAVALRDRRAAGTAAAEEEA